MPPRWVRPRARADLAEQKTPPPLVAVDGRVVCCLLEALPLEVISLLLSQLSVISLHRLALACRTFAGWARLHDEVVVDQISHPELRKDMYYTQRRKPGKFSPTLTLHGYRLRKVLFARPHVHALCFAWPGGVIPESYDQYGEVPERDLYEVLLGPGGDLVEEIVSGLGFPHFGNLPPKLHVAELAAIELPRPPLVPPGVRSSRSSAEQSAQLIGW
jgi:hypothetical protein